MFGEEFLDAVRRSMPTDHPMTPTLMALPRPIPYMNVDRAYARGVLVGHAVERWLWPRLERQTDPTTREVRERYACFDLAGGYEATERWAQSCAAVLTEADDRMLATQVSLAVSAALREDDARLVQSAADALLRSFSPRASFC